MTKVSMNLAAAVWKTLATEGSVTLKSEANEDVMTLTLKGNWGHGSRFSEGVSNGVVRVRHHGKVVKCWLHEVGFESFAAEFETLCTMKVGKAMFVEVAA